MTATLEVESNALARLRHRRPWVAPALVGGIIGLGTAYTAWQDPNTGGGLFPGCPLRELTGLDCPGCGGTRALHALTHGDIGTALDHNALLTVLMPLALLAWALWMIHGLRATLARRRDTGPPRWPAALRFPRLSHRAWLGVIGFLVAFAVIRNVSAVPALDYLASEA
ncbi:MAG TPA: DUF2752 domain-containing protein [Iamia sp.]